MYFADFETTTSKISDKWSKVWLWGVKGANRSDKLEYGVTIESFFETLKEKGMDEVYFHNLSFDGNYIYKYLANNDFKFVNIADDSLSEEDRKLRSNEWGWICDERGNIYSLYLNYKGFEITFLDSWKVLMASVEDLGESIGLEKQKLDYDAYSTYKTKEEVPKIALEYLERDIDVVIETFTRVIRLYDKKMTRASMSYNDFQEFYNEESDTKKQFSIDFGGKIWNYREKKWEIRNVLSKEDWVLIHKSYQGGYTNWNRKYTNKEIYTPNGVSYDVNSLYPSVMMNYKMPYGKLLYTRPIDTNDYVALKVVLIQRANILNKDWPALIKDKYTAKYGESKYLSEVKYEEYTFWEEEWEFIKSKYDIDYIELKTVYFRTKYVFKNWLEIKKELKINATDEIERDFHKGIYNSCYGKFAQNIRLGSRIIVEDGLIVKEIDGFKWLVDKETNEPYRPLNNRIRYGKNGEYKHTAFFSETDQYKHIAVASYIAMKARMTLWNAQYQNLDIWVYSDTDSCYFTNEPKGIEIHESKFGAWKAEHKFDKIKVLRAKCYMYHSIAAWKKSKWNIEDKDIKKISGLSKSGKTKVIWDNFHLGAIIKGGKRGTRNVDGGKLIVETDYKLGEDV